MWYYLDTVTTFKQQFVIEQSAFERSLRNLVDIRMEQAAIDLERERRQREHAYRPIRYHVNSEPWTYRTVNENRVYQRQVAFFEAIDPGNLTVRAESRHTLPVVTNLTVNPLDITAPLNMVTLDTRPVASTEGMIGTAVIENGITYVFKLLGPTE